MDDDELKLCGEVGKDARAFVRKYMELRKDAERYRWLRHGDNDDICIEFAEGVDCYADDVWLLRGEKLDAVIDAGIEHDAKAAEHVAVGPGLGAA